MSAGAAGSTAAAAAMQAKVATGMIVRVEPEEFLRLLESQEKPFVVRAPSRKVLFFEVPWRYLTPYRGLVFATNSKSEIRLPPTTELVQAQQIWVP